MDKEELEERTKRFALRVIRFVAAFPKALGTWVYLKGIDHGVGRKLR